MRTSIAAFAALLALVQTASAVQVWQQCGGKDYHGATNCDSGTHCQFVNDYYSQCQPGGGSGGDCTASTITETQTQTETTTETATSTDTATVTVTVTDGPTSTATPTGTPELTCSGDRTAFKFAGVNEAGAEFGDGKWPGTLDKDYTFPASSSIEYFVDKGFNTIRIPFTSERLVPVTDKGLLGDYNQTYLGILRGITNYVTSLGAYVVLDPHNYLRYNHSIVTDDAAFSGFWYSLASQFKDNDHVIFDLQNEPNGVAADTTFGMQQAAIYSIRAAGATSQLILVEGTSWTGAWTWTTSSGNAAAFTGLTDPANNVAVEMHQYLDADGSGSHTECVSETIGAERVAAATQWLKDNNLKGFLGEIGGASNPTCIAAVYNTLCALQQSGGTWLGFAWWAAGPWWGDYFQSIEPTTGPAFAELLPQALLPFVGSPKK